MKKLTLVLAMVILVVIYIAGGTSYADCQGCCSYHGGVCCIDDVTMCCDGTPLSYNCRAKGCDVCDDDDWGCFINTIMTVNDKKYRDIRKISNSVHNWKALVNNIVGWYEGKIISIEQLNSTTCWVVIRPVRSMSRAVEIAENVGCFIRLHTGGFPIWKHGETPVVHVFMNGKHVAVAKARGTEYIGKVDLEDWDPSSFDGEYRP